MLLWLNSTPSLLIFLSHRVATRSAWMKIKKPQWIAMPVLDIRGLDKKTLSKLSAAYDALSGRELQALAELEGDSVRAGIDDVLSAALGLPDMAALRQLLAHEPGLTGKAPAAAQKKQMKQTSFSLDTDEQETAQLKLV